MKNNTPLLPIHSRFIMNNMSDNIPNVIETNITNFSPETLIAQAIDKGVPVDTMERLLAMRRELKSEWSRGEYDKSMSAFQAVCPIIEKKKKVAFGTTRYSYAPLEEIVEQTKSLIADNGFSYTFDTKQSENAIKVFCHVKHKAGHSETSEFEIEIDSAAKMNKSQQYGAALTYAKRYAFCNALGISVGEEDTDAVIPPSSLNAPVQKATSNYPTTTPPPPQKPVYTPVVAPVPAPEASDPLKKEIFELMRGLNPLLESKEDFQAFCKKSTGFELLNGNYKMIITSLRRLKDKQGQEQLTPEAVAEAFGEKLEDKPF